jgi:hypothetical protein
MPIPHFRASQGRWLIATCLAASSTLSCGAEPDAPRYFEATELERHEIPSFEEFKSWAVVSEQGTRYMVEGDIPIRDDEALWAHYEARFLADRPKSAVRLFWTDGTGNACGTLSPNCVDDKFYSGQQRDLRYCVSNSFGANKAMVVAGMAAAATAWKAPTEWANTSHVKLTYVPTHDSVCDTDDPLPSSVYFKVAPWSRGGACAFWPASGVTCDEDGLDGRTIGFNPAGYTAAEAARTLTHEVGHVLGMHHEHMRIDSPKAASCFGYAEMRYLTEVDQVSVMAYRITADPCGLTSGMTVSPLDAAGIRRLYGIPVPWHVHTTLDISTSG